MLNVCVEDAIYVIKYELSCYIFIRHTKNLQTQFGFIFFSTERKLL